MCIFRLEMNLSNCFVSFSGRLSGFLPLLSPAAFSRLFEPGYVPL